MENLNKQEIMLAATTLASLQKVALWTENIRRRGAGEPPLPVPGDEEMLRAQTWKVLEGISDKSASAKAVDQFERMVRKESHAGIFLVDVLDVERDERNGRYAVSFMSIQPAGTEVEKIVTEPDWSDEGKAVSVLANRMKGHRCVMYKDIDSFKDKDGQSRKLRVLRHLKDLGPTPKN